MYRHSYLLALALFAANASQAQSAAPAHPHDLTQAGSAMARPLSLAAAIELAYQSNKTLAAARREIDAVEATIVQAGARPNPEFSALLEDTRKSSRTTTYQINQPIELGGKRQARIEAARRSYDMALLDYSARRNGVRAGVTAAYYALMVASERRRLARELAQLASTAAELSARRVSAGKIAPVEQTKAAVAQASAQLELNQADSELRLARQQLAMFWGALAGEIEPAAGEVERLPALPEIAMLTAQVATGPAVRLAQLEVERRRALAAIESSKRVPDLTLSLGKKRDEEAARNMWVVGVSVPIPLFDSNRGNQLEALRRVDKARDELAEVELQMQGEAARSHERLRNAREEAEALRTQIVPAAHSAYQVARTGFELGKFSFLEVLDAQRTYFQASAQYWNALSTAHQAAADIARLSGADIPPPSQGTTQRDPS